MSNDLPTQDRVDADGGTALQVVIRALTYPARHFFGERRTLVPGYKHRTPVPHGSRMVGNPRTVIRDSKRPQHRSSNLSPQLLSSDATIDLLRDTGWTFEFSQAMMFGIC